ncbi:MAG: gluconokinase [Syntrophales bacterium]
MVFVLMGVSGCGKSTIGRMLAHELQIPFYDADDFHSRENIRKMSAGHPLTDEDRYPWMMVLAEKIAAWSREGDAVLACSAIKEMYRETLSSEGKALFIYLKGDKVLILSRIMMRENHFMPAKLLNSQFHDLEEPTDAITVPIDAPPTDVVSMIICELLKRGLVAEKAAAGHHER